MTKKHRPNKTCKDCQSRDCNKLYGGRCKSCFKKAMESNREIPLKNKSRRPSREQGRTPANPTFFQPGSDGKKEIMRLRVSRGESCFHPDDSQWDESQNTSQLTEWMDEE